MTWKQEIFRAVLLAFGIGEIIANITYLIKKNGVDLARKQHQELPNNTSDTMIKTKVICMLIVGIIFFIVLSISYISHSYSNTMMLISLILFSIYGIGEALYYKYWKTIGFAIVTLILLSIYIFF
jgi:hypothetical protein